MSMSTEISSSVPGNGLGIECLVDEEVSLRLLGEGILRVVKRADFLAAVAAECNAIVIPREELPEVEDSHGGGPKWKSVGDELYPLDRAGAEYRDTARRLIAMAEYLDAHPPVDEAQVEALARVLVDIEATPDERGVGRHLIYVSAGLNGGWASREASRRARDEAREMVARGVTVKGVGNE